VFLDVAKDRLYTLAPDAPARRSAQTVLWRALRGLTLSASPALVHTAEEVWQHHPGLLAECESVHLAEWGDLGDPSAGSGDWEFLLEARDAVNAAIEPLRAARTLATTAEAEVTITAAPAWVERLSAWQDELTSLLIVAKAELRAGDPGAAPSVEVRNTTLEKCERCWTYRDDVVGNEGQPRLCSRCTEALAAR